MPNMRIYTNTALLVRKAQEFVMKLLLLHQYPLDCPVWDQGGGYELQEQSFTYGSDRGSFLFLKQSSSDTFWAKASVHKRRSINHSALNMAGMNTLQMIKTMPKFDGSDFVEWTRSFNDILQMTRPFQSKIVCVCMCVYDVCIY